MADDEPVAEVSDSVTIGGTQTEDEVAAAFHDLFGGGDEPAEKLTDVANPSSFVPLMPTPLSFAVDTLPPDQTGQVGVQVTISHPMGITVLFIGREQARALSSEIRKASERAPIVTPPERKLIVPG